MHPFITKLQLLLISLITSIIITSAIWQVTQNQVTAAQNWFTQGLLHTAWLRTQASGRQIKPWPWAKIWPVARLSIPHLQIEHIVLSQPTDSDIASTLTHLESSVPIGELGNSVLSVHQSLFRSFLKHLQVGDVLVLESPSNGRWHYRVATAQIVDKTDTRLLTPTLNRRLTLVSCYRCQANSNHLRYVVIAEEDERVAQNKF